MAAPPSPAALVAPSGPLAGRTPADTASHPATPPARPVRPGPPGADGAGVRRAGADRVGISPAGLQRVGPGRPPGAGSLARIERAHPGARGRRALKWLQRVGVRAPLRTLRQQAFPRLSPVERGAVSGPPGHTPGPHRRPQPMGPLGDTSGASGASFPSHGGGPLQRSDGTVRTPLRPRGRRPCHPALRTPCAPSARAVLSGWSGALPVECRTADPLAPSTRPLAPTP